MKSWLGPRVPAGSGSAIAPTLRDAATGTLVAASPPDPGLSSEVSLYVCGITPYDATHIGHAATYIAFDTLVRSWLFSGFSITYVQNVTDVDDPLLDRAAATGVDWRSLAHSQIDLFRSDMEALRVVPPEHFIAVTDVIDEIGAAVKPLVDRGLAYFLDTDVYLDIREASGKADALVPWSLGEVSGLTETEMTLLSAERGGDPGRAGKHHKIDPLLWRGSRAGEPSWPSPVGPGRPGWHIECAVIAAMNAHLPLTVQGGGSDLIFPHHELTAAHTATVHGMKHAEIFVHAGMVAFQGKKMSKSLGNLVFVSELIRTGADPRAIRLALLSHHYSSDWEWDSRSLSEATTRLKSWLLWANHSQASSDSARATEAGDVSEAAEVSVSVSVSVSGESIASVLQRLISADLDTAAAVEFIDSLAVSGSAASIDAIDAIDALLGIRLR
ncbi:MAG: class I tRNA ligase family protein [Microbacteriaceae bacterium]